MPLRIISQLFSRKLLFSLNGERGDSLGKSPTLHKLIHQFFLKNQSYVKSSKKKFAPFVLLRFLFKTNAPLIKIITTQSENYYISSLFSEPQIVILYVCRFVDENGKKVISRRKKPYPVKKSENYFIFQGTKLQSVCLIY